MPAEQLAPVIEAAWDRRDQVTAKTTGEVRDAVAEALEALDSGTARVAERVSGVWRVHQWLKKAVMLSFRLNDMATIPGGPGANTPWFDKVASKFANWDEARFRAAGFRAVPSCVVRHSAYIAPGVVLMPSFVNLGAYVDAGTMIDTWATRSARTATSQAAPASAACSSRCRRGRSSSRTTASSARAPRSPRG